MGPMQPPSSRTVTLLGTTMSVRSVPTCGKTPGHDGHKRFPTGNSRGGARAAVRAGPNPTVPVLEGRDPAAPASKAEAASGVQARCPRAGCGRSSDPHPCGSPLGRAGEAARPGARGGRSGPRQAPTHVRRSRAPGGRTPRPTTAGSSFP